MTAEIVQVRGERSRQFKAHGPWYACPPGLPKDHRGCWEFGAQLDCYVSASSLYVPSSDPREAGDNSSGLRSGSGAEWK